jgi:hypothetical protein
MANEALDYVYQNIKESKERIKIVEDLISAMREAGEDTSSLTAELNSAKLRMQKWENMLKGRGYKL